MKPLNPTVVLYNSFTASILLKSPLEMIEFSWKFYQHIADNIQGIIHEQYCNGA